ncbi:hypothetical protein T10_494 [Trichinella papuae]|uniref:Uncharacterized protein n=1 Tax=Trichinella papuae TaxID=268474 RepID=A0A0V1N432_9BILA|nr:hypothetical protein T10_494 [Trichinella papuae]
MERLKTWSMKMLLSFRQGKIRAFPCFSGKWSAYHWSLKQGKNEPSIEPPGVALALMRTPTHTVWFHSLLFHWSGYCSTAFVLIVPTESGKWVHEISGKVLAGNGFCIRKHVAGAI